RRLLAPFGGVEVGSVPQLQLRVVTVAPDKAEALLSNLRAKHAVEDVSPDDIRQVAGGVASTSTDNWALQKIGWQTAYRKSTVKRSVRVAVLDTASATSDPNGHGTWMASIVRSVDPRARVLSLQVLNANGYGKDSD